MNFDASIPVIDMRDYYDLSRRHIFVGNLVRALQSVGFVAVVNSNIDPKILDRAYNVATEFYAQDTAKKMQAYGTGLNGQRGFVQSEVAAGQTKLDHKEFYHIAEEYTAEVKDKHGYLDNIWPADRPEFKEATLGLIRELKQYVPIIESAIAEGLDLPLDFFSKMTGEGASLLRSIHYPAHPPADCLWAAEHTDIDLLTILPRATEKGLQVQTVDGKWIDVIVPDGAFIINAGDMLENLTNGLIKSARHRVIGGSYGIERYSMVWFVHPRPQDRMDPLPQFIAKVGEQRYPNAQAWQLLAARLKQLGLASKELQEELERSGFQPQLSPRPKARL